LHTRAGGDRRHAYLKNRDFECTWAGEGSVPESSARGVFVPAELHVYEGVAHEGELVYHINFFSSTQ
jgi:hypothetical protein